MQVYIYILIYTIPTYKDLCLSLKTSETLPSIHLTPLTLCLIRAVQTQDLVTLPICWVSLSTWTNLAHQVILFYFNQHITVFPQRLTLP